MAGRRPRPQRVYVNVYDLSDNSALYNLGLGMYHSGIEVDGREFTFASGAGIFSHAPRGAQGARFREQLYLGDVSITAAELDRLIARLKPDWPGTKYNVLKCNCNHFADALSNELLSRGIPLWINRMSSIGSFFSCLVPSSVLGAAPVDDAASAEPRAAPPRAFAGTAHRLDSTSRDAPARPRGRGNTEEAANSLLAGIFAGGSGSGASDTGSGGATNSRSAGARSSASVPSMTAEGAGASSTSAESVRSALAAAALARLGAAASAPAPASSVAVASAPVAARV